MPAAYARTHTHTRTRTRTPALPWLTPLLPWLLWLASCSSPPKPPQVDVGNRRPANAAHTVELHSCRTELHNARLLAREAPHTPARAAEPQSPAAPPPQPALPPPAQANGVYTLHFGYGSTRITLPPEAAAALADEARQAPLVLLRGRTDGRRDTAGDSRIAAERAAAVRQQLVAAGVDPARIRTTHQPAGDYAADNTSPTGRSLNRRVEVEVYRASPVALNPATHLQH